ncbi:hypothetical protein [Fervidobacterium thailandense]|uniref:Uncharacterized protein n=1 Tax=Fervidobacterium thailandense TaxID=1008305 RepID=A0A1E3G2K7_9BACT|nr:hypothetical protein [Fervidobacterium thailandense]ODN30392.1 hypothetical protein A4H02_05970 [Fervidobacterium thailandense]
MAFFDNLFLGLDESLKREFLQIKELHEKDFQTYREDFVNAFWKVFEAVANVLNEDSPIEQKLFIRLGLVDPRYVGKDDLDRIKEMFSSFEHETVFYTDEWLIAVKSGKVQPSTFEDVIQDTGQPRTVDVTWLIKEYERKLNDRMIEEEKLRDLVKGVQSKGPYTKGVYVVLDEIVRTIGNLKRMDAEIKGLHETIASLEQVRATSKEIKETKKEQVIFSEVLVIKQMVKKSVGKFGINYPVLSSNFLKDVNFVFAKQVTCKLLEELISIEPSTFQRKIKNSTIFMPPYVIIVPSYGEIGFCWEPVEGTNIYGRGRVVIPTFSRKGVEPFYQAFGDYRWKLEKELSFGRWMEEGLTGEYYRYLEENKIKGNPAELFARDYVLWISKESKGIQKLEKQVREIFWYRVPFNDKVKEKLSQLSYVYKELWERDLRRRQREGEI